MLAHAHCRHAYALSEHATIQHSAFGVQCQLCESCRSLLSNTTPLTSDSGVPSTTGMQTSAGHSTTRHAPIIPHNDPHPVPPPHAQVQQPPREGLYVPIELTKVPREVRRVPEVASARPAVCPGGLLARDERGARAVEREDVFPEEAREGLWAEWGVQRAADF